MSARRISTPRFVKFLSTVSEREIRVIASDGTTDRMGDILVAAGCELERFRRNPICLAQHDSNQPIGKCSSISIEGDKVLATIQFPPVGTNENSDLYCRLMKSGVLSAVSVGFIPLRQEPIQSGWKFTSWELLELSCVSVPANPNALVTERSFTGSTEQAARLASAAVRRARLNGIIVPAAPPPDDGWVTRRLAHARQEHERLLNQRAAADAAGRALQW